MSEILGDVRATGFTLCDEDGKARASLSLRNGAAQFVMGDGKGRVRVSLSVDEAGDSRFLLADAKRNARIGMDCYDDGPSFFVRDSSGALRIGLDYDEKSGTAQFVFVSDEERTRLCLTCSTDDDSVRVSLLDTEGGTRVEMRSQGDDHSIVFMNESGVVETIVA